jgi:ATP-dependent RNA helicase DDX10/DBP4
VAVHAEAETPTPVKLDQAFMECPLPDKMDILWSFVKTHLKCRVIVFLSTCKQVRFVYEAFRRLRPGTPLRALHGKMSQYKRMGVYTQFCDSKAGVLFATDIAARGLDFPAVDWVVQADCPEDVATYIHRVGRTARYTSAGRSLLLLLPSERDAMLEHLREGKIELKSLKHNPSKVQPVTPALQALLSKDSELKEIAQRALVSYVRSVFLQPNKNIFDVSKLPIEEFALSFGMTTIPKLRFLQRDGRAKLQKQASHSVQPPVEVDNVEHRDLSVLQKDNRELETGEEEIDDEGDDFLVVKRKNILEEGDAGEEEAGQQLLNMDALLSNPKKRPKKLKINVKSAKGSGTRVVFDDDGKTVDPLSLVTVEDSSADGVVEHESVEERIAAARLIMAKRDEEDKANIRLLRKLKRDERRAKRLARERGDQMDAVAVLAGAGEEGDDDYNGGSDDGDALDTGAYGSGEGEIAHKGMATLLGSGVPGNAISRHLPTSLDEQEALALHLLRGGVGN